MAEVSMLGQRIKMRREELGLSQRQLAEQAMVPRGTLSALEAGYRNHVSTDFLLGTARALHCSADWLIGLYAHMELILNSLDAVPAVNKKRSKGGKKAREPEVRHDHGK